MNLKSEVNFVRTGLTTEVTLNSHLKFSNIFTPDPFLPFPSTPNSYCPRTLPTLELVTTNSSGPESSPSAPASSPQSG